MIEVVPFFHKMAFTIMAKVGEENPQAVIATTITSYAISSVITGLVFFLMGTCGFGYIVGFIPRHILIGCIGGVGWFLVATGFEVTARLDGNLNYDLSTLRKMFSSDTLVLWVIPFALAAFLYWSQHKITSKYYLPTYILTIPAIFYFFVFSLDKLDPAHLRETGWIFEGPEAGEPWWYFYIPHSPLPIPLRLSSLWPGCHFLNIRCLLCGFVSNDPISLFRSIHSF
jgi:SulP family sulfate permease